jgi:hypothetical protein
VTFLLSYRYDLPAWAGRLAQSECAEATQYLWQPLAPEEIPTGHLTDGARVAAEITGHVRWFGSEHAALEQWKATGSYELFGDPMATRW